MFINIVQSFSYLWRINKYQQKIDMNLNHISLTAIILKCLGIVQSVSWFLHLCLTKQLSNEREIPCSRFLSQSKLLRWRQMLRTVFFVRKQLMQSDRQGWPRHISIIVTAERIISTTETIPRIVYSKLLMKEIEINCKTQIWQLTHLFQEKMPWHNKIWLSWINNK